ncbi:MAG: branched-chain amino acid transaminase [Candidatus Dormibacteraeota bacterium]|nr:branched-chain amino acid transaminase [Candidatus Dormibacteraeota bacterium]MBV9526173.1 branched-chain amino acid transaminase [Candidatus Dormibacteraeota bacterium]
MTQTAPAKHDAGIERDRSWVFFNGEVVLYADAKVGLLTHGLNYGTGIFEGIRAYWNETRKQLYVLRMPEHYERMHNNARALQMAIPHGIDELCAITKDLLRRNGFREDAYIRPLCFKAAEIIGVRLHDVPDSFGIVTSPMGPYVGTEGIRCLVSSWRRIDDTMAPVRMKCTGLYVNSALAKSEALQAGFDEAIMLTHDGHVSEGSAENIFIVRKGAIFTPPPSDNILEGITRSAAMHLVREEMGLEVEERSIDRTELYVADEVFFVGTGAQVAPVVEIDRRRIGDGEPGPLTMRLQGVYSDVVTGHNPKYEEWLTPVY